MAGSALLLNIGDMIDLAIGTPEVGVVDFNMLQTVLHCLAQQLRVLDKNVEIRGSPTSMPWRDTDENVQTIDIREFSVDLEDQVPVKKTELPPPAHVQSETLLVVERVKKSEAHNRESHVEPTHRDSATSDTKQIAPSTTKQVEPSDPNQKVPSSTKISLSRSTSRHAETLSLVTQSKFNVLEKAVDEIRERVFSSIPKNETILEEVRSQTNVKAIQDMWSSLNVSSRLEAAEAGLAKLSSLVEDLIAETTELQEASMRRTSKIQQSPGSPQKASSAPVLTSGEQATSDPDAISDPKAKSGTEATTGPQATTDPQATTHPPATSQPDASSGSATQEDLGAVQAQLQQLRADLDALRSNFNAALGGDLPMDMQAEEEAPTAAPIPGSLPHSPRSPTSGAETGVQVLSPSSSLVRERRSSDRRSSLTLQGLTQRVTDLENRIRECCDEIQKKDGIVNDHLQSNQDQLDYVLKQVAVQSDELGSGKLSPDLIKDLQGLMVLFETVQNMQGQLNNVHETAVQLAAEKDNRQNYLDSLVEQIELLKIIKLDREDMAEAMADKADVRMLARKVSHDQFEVACDDLSKGLEHALGKLNLQEALWQQALDDIQREIETKLDKMDMSQVKDFFNNKLKTLQDNLKHIGAMRKEAEAAGTKRRLLRDVNCISCDAKAVMAMDAASTIPVAKPMPPTMSMKPYLSYELDAIRKTQQSQVPARNMHDWENIDKQMAHVKQPHKVRSDTDKHLCNRYCGGSHTVTTPAQRVARLGHFMKQWGPDVLPLSSGLSAGDDGRMYRVTQDGANVGPGGTVDTTCTPKSPKKSDAPKSDFKPTIVLNPECRCLEGIDHLNDRSRK